MKRAIVLFIVSLIIVPLHAQVDRSKPPQPGPAPEVNLGKYESFKLDNGLKVFVVENRKIPRVGFYFLINRDPLLQKDQAGYITAAGQLLGTATKTRTKDEIDNEVDFMGATLNTFSTGVFGMSLRSYSDSLLNIISDVVENSVFKKDELDKIKKRMKSELLNAEDNPQSIANVVGDVLRYGRDFPYGDHPSVQSIEKITLEKCREYYSTYFKPNISYLAIVGDMSAEEAKPLVEKYFGSWKAAKVPQFSYKIPQPPAKTEVAMVDRPNSVQSIINVTYPVILKPGSGDVIKSAVMNTILGGGAFRLFKDLRETHGYTYGAYSNLSMDQYVGYFNAEASVRNAVTDSAVARILYEMKKIRDENVSSDELQEAKNYLSGNFAIALEQPQTIAAFAINIDKYNLPKDYYRNYLKNVAAVTIGDVRHEAENYIKPDHAYILVVGNADKVSNGLKQFGPVVDYDRRGNKIENSVAEIPKGLTGRKVVDNYIEAIGGKENIRKVKDRTTYMTGEVRGQKISMTVYQKAPDKLKQVIEAGPMKQNVYFDGKTGIMEVGGKKLEVNGNELEKLKLESTLDLLTNLDKMGIKTELLGMEKVDGKNTYKVAMIFPSGTKWIQYYDPQTWLKVKEQKNITVPQGTFTQNTYLGNYKNVDGVKYPFYLKQTLGAQSLTFKVDSIKVNSGLNDSMFEAR